MEKLYCRVTTIFTFLLDGIYFVYCVCVQQSSLVLLCMLVI